MRYARFGVWFLIATCLIRIADFVAGWLLSSDPTTSAVSLYSIAYFAPFWIINLAVLSAFLVILRRAWRPGIWAIFLLSLVFSLVLVAGDLTSIGPIWDSLAEQGQHAAGEVYFRVSPYFILRTAWSLIGTAAVLAICGGTAYFLFFKKRLPRFPPFPPSSPSLPSGTPPPAPTAP